MADKELAAKLAKRLVFTGEESDPKPEGSAPPPVPDMPKKIVENPYVASDPSFSVDDLILKTLEFQEENNNYQTSLNSPPSPQPSPSAKSPLPPKQTIRDWIMKDQPQPVNAVPKNPIVPVEHHKAGGLTKAPSTEKDGSELERKLAAQRAKKSAAEVVREEETPVEAVVKPAPIISLADVVAEKTDIVTDKGRVVSVAPAVTLEPKRTENTYPESISETSAEPVKTTETAVNTNPVEATEGGTEVRKTSFEELEEQMQREVEEEERRKAEEQKAPPKPPRVMDESVTASPTAQKKQLVPSPLLMEAIRQECGLKSPPPPTAPKPQTPTNSRPQSPVVTKKAPEQNPEELEKLLERQRKINDGDVVPQFVNRKMSLYTEFSEFTRKQIKSLTETFRKYDEDGDSFIDFMELKRMMEKLGEAQTHIALKEIIKKVDEDQDGKINLREFFLLFRLAAKGELGCSEIFNQLAESIDVSKEGVLAAASFFQAKIAEQTKLSKFEEEIKQEQDEKKREEEEKRARREKFQQSRNLFH